MKPTLFLTDDSDMLLNFLEFFYREKFDVIRFNNSKEAMGFIEKIDIKIDAALIDLHIPGLDGVEIIKQFMKKNPTAEISMMTGKAEQSVLQRKNEIFEADSDPIPFELNILISFEEKVIFCA